MWETVGQGGVEREKGHRARTWDMGRALPLGFVLPISVSLPLKREIFAGHLPTPQTRGFPQTVQQEERMEERRCAGEKRFPN